MSYDMFGDLQDWGRVLDQVQKMRADGALDEHQQGLARIARYPFNWQLRQAGLRAIAELKRPCDEVIQVSVQIMMDEKNDLETRILAGHAVSGVLRIGNGTLSERTRSEAANSIRDLLAQPQPPVLHAFARGWEDVLSETSKSAATTQ
jgi:hypothetical protein